MNKNVLHSISYGMYIVSSKYMEKDSACVINTLTQITSKNPIVSVSINKDNFTNQIIKNSKKFVVSILSEETDPEIIKVFGYNTSKEIDKFENQKFITEDDIKVITDKVVGYAVCDVIDSVDCESHDVFLGRVVKNVYLNDLAPMTYKYYREVLKGTSPKNAPTFVENVEVGTAKKYRCQMCGFIYDDAVESVKFEDLPNDWTCPLCGASKDSFEEIK